MHVAILTVAAMTHCAIAATCDDPLADQPPAAEHPSPGSASGGQTEPGQSPAPAASAPPQSASEVAVPYPHPMIVEVLYAVPTGTEGDANGDGRRHVSGDEFVEIFNPHDRPIQLRGYRLTDSNPADKGQVRFVFPMFELPPGGVAVVFNGYKCSWFGPVGDDKAAPPAPNDRFDGAWVFTMKASSQYVAFSNAGDHVLLTAPDGTAVQRVSWGEPKDRAAFDRIAPLLDDVAPQTGKSSVQRDGPARVAAFRAHLDLPYDLGDGRPFSPGRWKPVPEPKTRANAEENSQRAGREGHGEKQEK